MMMIEGRGFLGDNIDRYAQELARLRARVSYARKEQRYRVPWMLSTLGALQHSV